MTFQYALLNSMGDSPKGEQITAMKIPAYQQLLASKTLHMQLTDRNMKLADRNMKNMIEN